MSDKFIPTSMHQLTKWIFTELEEKNSIFGIPKSLFFTPEDTDKFKVEIYSNKLETPFGVAAGPHSQMAQNIIAAWLCGARFIELKTVQTLDELEVSKPCIDMLDAGYNVEWSQELRLSQSFDEYLRAWVLIHALHRKLDFPGNSPGIIFNLSVGYNYEGILKPNVQQFLRKMRNAGEYLDEEIKIVSEYYPEINDITIPHCLSNNITLSTMHGCPPEEIGKIATYLIEEQELNTNVKLNPTLLGPEELRRILNQNLGYREITVPDIAFEHDLKYPDAISLLVDLQKKADKKGVIFGVKLSNTLEVENHRTVFDKQEKMMYMSGRPLHALTVNLAKKLAIEFDGNLLMSFAGGADCFNASELLRSGMSTITISSDILRPGGYTRLLQYIKNTIEAMESIEAEDISDFICKSAVFLELDKVIPEDLELKDFIKANALENLKQYAEYVLTDPLLIRDSFERKKTKTNRKLELFDCIKAPCTDECPINQKAPAYIEQISKGNIDEAAEIIRKDNPLPTILGKACNHQCETVCTRTHYDEPIAIRELKRFAIENSSTKALSLIKKSKAKVAIIGAGPCGLSAAHHLTHYGFKVTIFEERSKAAGMVSQTIPSYRATENSIKEDIASIENLGVEMRYNTKFGKDITAESLKGDGYDYIIIAVGAQKGMLLGIQGEDSEGVVDGIDFLRNVKLGKEQNLGAKVGVIGAGDVAMDCARVANRLTGGKVYIIYRRSIEQMPAHKEELDGTVEEGIEIKELAAPKTVITENGHITALRCSKMKLGELDSSGRKRPIEIPDSEFDIQLDNLIIAIGQQPDFSFLQGLPLELNKKGYIDVNSDTLETSIENVYAGGDAIQNGPLTIVKACGDGKIIADSINHTYTSEYNNAIKEVDEINFLAKRAFREFRTLIPHIPPEQRDDFNEIVQSLDKESAEEEANRCLKCDRYCNTCVTVCPNKAILSYKIKPFELQLPIINKNITEHFEISQPYQTAIFTSYCNECENCAIFCPTSGKPHKDKPRLYNNIKEFEAESDNAFMIFNDNGNWSIKAKFNNKRHELILADELLYSSSDLKARLDEKSFKLISVEVSEKAKEDDLSLMNCAIMYTIMTGIKDSMPELPVN